VAFSYRFASGTYVIDFELHFAGRFRSQRCCWTAESLPAKYATPDQARVSPLEFEW